LKFCPNIAKRLYDEIPESDTKLRHLTGDSTGDEQYAGK
jgi:hypothetical protein